MSSVGLRLLNMLTTSASFTRSPKSTYLARSHMLSDTLSQASHSAHSRALPHLHHLGQTHDISLDVITQVADLGAVEVAIIVSIPCLEVFNQDVALVGAIDFTEMS